MRLNARFLFLNAGHTVDHLMMLLFPAVAVIMAAEIDGSYAEILALSTGGFIAFGAFSLPAGWLADRWSRERMIAIFFLGIGAATALTGLATGPWQIAGCLFLIGVFAAIYHPVGIAMVSQGGGAVGKRLGINGVWGNMGVAASALVAGALADLWGWRAAFFVPGAVSMAIGIAWIVHCRSSSGQAATAAGAAIRKSVAHPSIDWKRVLTVVFVATAFGGFIFNATTVSLPKVFDERVVSLAHSGTEAGSLIALVYAVAAFTQVAVGHLIDRYPVKRVFLLLAIGDVAIFLVAAQTTGSAMVGVALAMMMLVFGQIPITDTLVARNTPEHWRSRVYALKYVLSFAIAATAVPAVSALHAFGGGFTALFLICAGCATAIALAVTWLPSGRAVAAPVPGE